MAHIQGGPGRLLDENSVMSTTVCLGLGSSGAIMQARVMGAGVGAGQNWQRRMHRML